MTFQNNLKKYREIAGYSQAKEFAEKIGVPYQTYMGYENRGREPKFSTLIKMADTLHVSIDNLLGYKAHTPDALEKAMLDIKECGFLVFPDNRDQTQPIEDRPIHIINEAESNETGDDIYTMDGKTLIDLSQKIDSMAMNTYRESKHQLYKLAFDEVQKLQAQLFYDQLKNDPRFKELRDKMTNIAPNFFDMDNIKDEDNDNTPSDK